MKISKIKSKLILVLTAIMLFSALTFCAFNLAVANEPNSKYSKFFVASDDVSVEYKEAGDLLYPDIGSGLKVLMKDYTKITFNKTIDLSLEEVKSSFMNFYVVPLVDGQSDFTEMFVYLYDVNNSENYLKIRL